jgi:hypothetical protein
MVASSVRAVIRPTLAILICALAGACETASVRDMTVNPALYKDLGYKATHVQSRSYHLGDLADGRQQLPTHSKGIFPRAYTDDRHWARPVLEMLGTLIDRELAASGIFKGGEVAEADADWVIKPELIEFHGAIEEKVAGRTVLGQTKLHYQVLGPRDASGERPVLREHEIGVPIDAHGFAMVPDPYAMAAASFRRTLALWLADLERGGMLADGKQPEKRLEPKKVEWTPGQQPPAK